VRADLLRGRVECAHCLAQLLQQRVLRAELRAVRVEAIFLESV
jgi:hypothetical protein